MNDDVYRDNSTTKWHSRFLRLAAEISIWSKDSTNVGAVAIGGHKQVVAQGFNGFPRAIKDLPERFQSKEEKYKYTIHAEMNLVYNAILTGTSIFNCTVYVYGVPPCFECAKGLIQCGISCIVIRNIDVINCHEPWKTRWKEAESLFLEAGVRVMLHEDYQENSI